MPPLKLLHSVLKMGLLIKLQQADDVLDLYADIAIENPGTLC
jgi:hypothetical protein